jgi:nucleoid-associated protein YgaU
MPAAPETERAPGTQAGPVGMSSSRPRGDRAVPGAHGPRNVGPAGDAPLRRHAAAGRHRGMPARDTRIASRRSTVRLTRRGRIVVATLLTALFLLLVALAWMVVAARAQAANHGLPQGAVYRNMTSVVVHPGQTLWSIASQAEPSADPRVVMQLIIELNALHGTSVVPGQHLWVPRG